MIVDLLIFLAVLSLLVFFHELGHFAAAKSFGIYVKRFSIGMPPRIFGFQWGETDYCVGALPLGGFVMMAGQEDVPLSDEDREKEYGHVPESRWFKNKPVTQRILVLLAGPFMNLILAVLLYGLVGIVGSYVPEWEVEARVGEIDPNAPANQAPLYLVDDDAAEILPGREPDATGWQIGDRILSIDGRHVGNMTDLAIAAVLGGGTNTHDIILERPDVSGGSTRYLSRVKPEVLDESGHARFGVGPYETAIVRTVLPGSPAEQAGFREEDVIYSVDGRPVTLSGFIRSMEETEEGRSVSVEIVRGDTPMTIAVSPHTIGRVRGLSMGSLSGDDGPITVLSIAGDVKEKTGLQLRDVIVEVNGKAMSSAELAELEEANPGMSLGLKVLRPARMFGLAQEEETFTTTVTVDAVRAIGVALRPRTVLQRVPPSRIIQHSFYQSFLAVERTILTISGLFTQKVSPKDLGGPLMIFEVTTKAAQAGLDWLIKITAFISVNLFILNLLPLPVLDGGQVVLNAIEATRGKPVNEKFLERLQQVGIIMLIALMLYVTYNDLSRFIMGWLS